MFGNGHWENCLFCPNPYSLTKLRSFPKREMVQSALGPADFLSLAVAICTFMHPNPKKIRNKTASIFFSAVPTCRNRNDSDQRSRMIQDGPGWSRSASPSGHLETELVELLGLGNSLFCQGSAIGSLLKVLSIATEFIWFYMNSYSFHNVEQIYYCSLLQKKLNNHALRMRTGTNKCFISTLKLHNSNPQLHLRPQFSHSTVN